MNCSSIEDDSQLIIDTSGPFKSYRLVQSLKNPCLSDIVSFTYGGTSARFAMLRPYFNSSTFKQIESFPFFAWECISVFTKSFSFDIVI